MFDSRSISRVLVAALYTLPFLIYLKYALGLPSQFLLLFDAVIFVAFVLSILVLWQPGSTATVPLIGTLLFFLGLGLILHPNIPAMAVGLEGLRKSYLFIVSVVVGFCFIRRIEVCIRSFLAIVSIFVLYGIKQYFSMSAVDYEILRSQYSDEYTFLIGGVQRISGLFSSPFIFGAASCFGLVLSLHCFSLAESKIFWVPFVFLFLVGVGLSVTRTNMVVSVSVVMLWAFLKLQTRPAYQLLSVGASFLLIVSALVIAPDVWNIMSADDRFFNRFHMWNTVFKDVFHDINGFLFGYGTGSSGDTLSNKYSHFQFKHVSSHNIFLRYFFEGGIFLGLTFLVFIAGLIWVGFRVRERFVYFGSFLIILVGGFSYSSVEIWPVNIMIGLMLGGIFGASQGAGRYIFGFLGNGTARNE